MENAFLKVAPHTGIAAMPDVQTTKKKSVLSNQRSSTASQRNIRKAKMEQINNLLGLNYNRGLNEAMIGTISQPKANKAPLAKSRHNGARHVPNAPKQPR